MGAGYRVDYIPKAMCTFAQRTEREKKIYTHMSVPQTLIHQIAIRKPRNAHTNSLFPLNEHVITLALGEAARVTGLGKKTSRLKRAGLVTTEVFSSAFLRSVHVQESFLLFVMLFLLSPGRCVLLYIINILDFLGLYIFTLFLSRVYYGCHELE